MSFLLTNFGEMNKLWVRLQNLGSARERTKRERERQNLKQLVGAQLVRLSELQGCTLELYAQTILPALSEQIINCKDVIAQEFLLDCLVQVFPAEYHLHTLEPFLACCQQLHESVNIKDVMCSLMNRLSAFVVEQTAMPPQQISDLFQHLWNATKQIATKYTKLSGADFIALLAALATFIARIDAHRLSAIDGVLETAAGYLAKLEQPASALDADLVTQVVDLLSMPLSSLSLAAFEVGDTDMFS